MSTDRLRIGVVGGGAFGRGVAKAASRTGHEVTLWSRRAGAVDDARIRVSAELADLAAAELIFLAVPSHVAEQVATELGEHLDGGHLLAHVSRGLVGDALEPVSSVIRRLTPVRRVGALAGPLVADALALGTPSGAVVGSHFPEVADAVREAIAGPSLRLYATDDIVGVEVASALVGLLALAVGHAQARGVGPAALATFLTRGMAEASRLAERLGGDPKTLAGLAGYGDLLAVMAGDERPEQAVGRALAEGRPLLEATRDAGGYIEGVTIAERVVTFAAREGIEVPICDAIARVLAGRPAAEVLQSLMVRSAGGE
ncbi:MAG: NAD(P)-binding domain-containing protein [Myxococcales bacterium]|nr:NAD(P)-binding domain-containing protein [Myxococcales bacterium]